MVTEVSALGVSGHRKFLLGNFQSDGDYLGDDDDDDDDDDGDGDDDGDDDDGDDDSDDTVVPMLLMMRRDVSCHDNCVRDWMWFPL
eukprot:s135_g26.t1